MFMISVDPSDTIVGRLTGPFTSESKSSVSKIRPETEVTDGSSEYRGSFSVSMSSVELTGSKGFTII